MDNKNYLQSALKEAQKALKKDEVPVGAVIVKNNKIISRAHNIKETKKNCLCHAEIIAINKASKKLNSWHLDGCTLYVTLEPCSMCAGAIIQARIAKVIYGALDLKGGAIESCYQMYAIKGFNHYPDTSYDSSITECSSILSNYFKKKRKTKHI